MEDKKDIKKDKLSYEELNNACNQLYMQNAQLSNQVRALNEVINVLPFLFEVIKNKDFFNEEFVKMCVSNIESILTPEVHTSEDKKD